MEIHIERVLLIVLIFDGFFWRLSKGEGTLGRVLLLFD
jgi:hypothetical protein